MPILDVVADAKALSGWMADNCEAGSVGAAEGATACVNKGTATADAEGCEHCFCSVP